MSESTLQENITFPPTRLDVVMETMKISQKVASECDEAYMVVHYDLAIAKPALQIQATESPRFDNLFIAFGPFHFCLAYFGAIGHFIENSGGPEILTESDVLAPGSLNGFISGRHYNRYVRTIKPVVISQPFSVDMFISKYCSCSFSRQNTSYQAWVKLQLLSLVVVNAMVRPSWYIHVYGGGTNLKCYVHLTLNYYIPCMRTGICVSFQM